MYIANPLETRFPQPSLPERITGIILLAGAERPAASEAYGEPLVGDSGQRYVTTLRLAARYPDARIVFTGGPKAAAGQGPLGNRSPPLVKRSSAASVSIHPGSRSTRGRRILAPAVTTPMSC